MAKKEECATCTKAKNVGSWNWIRCSYFGRQPKFDDTPCQQHSTDEGNTIQCPDCGAKHLSSWKNCPFCASAHEKENKSDVNGNQNTEVNTEDLPPQCPSCGSRNVVFKTKLDKKKTLLVFIISIIVGFFIFYFSFEHVYGITASLVGLSSILIIPLILAILAGRTVACKCRKCGKEFDNSTSEKNATPKTSIDDAPRCPKCGSRLIFERTKKSPKYWLINSIIFVILLLILIIFGMSHTEIIRYPFLRIFWMVVPCLLSNWITDIVLPNEGNVVSYKCRKCKHVFGTNKKRK